MARKIEGEHRNKELTKKKLIDSVGEVLRREGYTKLGVNNIANHAGVSKKLIYRYFESVDNLIEAYIKEMDFWMTLRSQEDELANIHSHNFGRDLASTFLGSLFEHLEDRPEAQKIILYELSENNKLLHEISMVREMFGSKLFKMTDPIFEGTGIDLRAVYAILLGGVYYMTLHANGAGGTVCEIDSKKDEGKQRLIKAMETIVEMCYNEAERVKLAKL
ncbi:TetR/AcrR family transcriptional regulator [Parapedobacter koreensis]|uniref:Transcriptional regulator, TetR family n=1 Tax=Parapedobacter koreensis TaxID=332977 RepID=A0A1H7ISQ9_9SPHI|nr:TetR/AcrR family transcriptional regulator [Parapedobacter koreensis]SEK65438.1 transcriptional regulator, TetR family [Parapedobacter koreensis]